MLPGARRRSAGDTSASKSSSAAQPPTRRPRLRRRLGAGRRLDGKLRPESLGPSVGIKLSSGGFPCVLTTAAPCGTPDAHLRSLTYLPSNYPSKINLSVGSVCARVGRVCDGTTYALVNSLRVSPVASKKCRQNRTIAAVPTLDQVVCTK